MRLDAPHLWTKDLVKAVPLVGASFPFRVMSEDFNFLLDLTNRLAELLLVTSPWTGRTVPVDDDEAN
jgi:hypothetical protein